MTVMHMEVVHIKVKSQGKVLLCCLILSLVHFPFVLCSSSYLGLESKFGIGN